MSQPLPVTPNETHLIWVDMEMTGLKPEVDRIIEVAVVVTDSALNPLATGPVLAIHQPESVMLASPKSVETNKWSMSIHETLPLDSGSLKPSATKLRVLRSNSRVIFASAPPRERVIKARW